MNRGNGRIFGEGLSLHHGGKRSNSKDIPSGSSGKLGRDRSNIYKVLIAGFILMIPFLTMVAADGCVVVHGEESLEFLLEEDQYAMIDLEDGIQKMLIKIDIEKKDVDNSTWILPIPASPQNVRFDMEANMPHFEGQNLEKAYQEELDDHKRELLSSYYLSFFPGLRVLGWGQSFTDEAGGGYRGDSDINIHSTIEFEGIHSELVSTENSTALVEYLQGKGLPIQMGTLDSFDHYVENEFSFIITWMNTNSLKGLTPALYVDFPTPQIYYPMLLTSEYGDREVPVNLLINDWVKYEDDIELSKYTEFTYYRDYWGMAMENHEYYTMLDIQEKYPETKNMDYDEIREEYGHLLISHYLENQTDHSRRFTYVEIDAKASEFKEDLYFRSFEPDVVEKQRKLDEASDPYLFHWDRLISFIFFSMFTGAISGLLFFRKDRSKIMISSLISLFNIMAIWVFTIATLIFFRPKGKRDWFRFFGYTAVYHLIFFTLVMIFIEPLFIFI